MKRAVIIQGAPGVGKTTLAQRLCSDLSTVLIAKDDIKEHLYDSLGHPVDKAESELYGRIAIRAMYGGMDEFIKADRLVLIEAALVPAYALEDLTPIVSLGDILQIYVYCDLDVHAERFSGRSSDGSRHPGHADTSIDPAAAQKRNSAIPGIATIMVDTTDFSEDNYHQVLEKVRSALGGGKA